MGDMQVAHPTGHFLAGEPRQLLQGVKDWTHIFTGEFESRADFRRKGRFDKG